MFSIFTQVMKPVRNTNNEPGLPVIRTDEKVLGDKNIPNLPFKYQNTFNNAMFKWF